MSLLAPGGKTPVYATALMGIATLCVAVFVHPLGHLVTLVGVLLLVLSTFLANFFRDPDRVIPKDEGVLVASADGHVMFVVRERAIGRRPSKAEMESGEMESDEHTGEWLAKALDAPLSFATEQRWERVPAGEEGEDDVWRIAVFMSPLDVHVNRAPLASTITHMEHRTGKGRQRGPFLPAFRKESEFNERVRTVFSANGKGGHPEGMVIEVTQISGALARTIVPWSQIGMDLRRGQRYGMIRLGSRVDTRAPAARFTPVVVGAEAEDEDFPKGEYVYAGKTILFSSSRPE
jgi:phosphatidylserine decarboxylase